MGIRARKTFKAGPVRMTVSKSGVSTSIGVKGVRVGKMANGKTRTTVSVPGTGISYVTESKKKEPAELPLDPSTRTPPIRRFGNWRKMTRRNVWKLPGRRWLALRKSWTTAPWMKSGS